MAARATMNGTSQAGQCGLSLWLTVVLTLCLGLSACGGGSNSERPPDAAQPPSPPTASDFKLLPARVSLTVGGQGAMWAMHAPGAVAWTSSNPAVASVDSTGLITAQAVGSAVISAVSRTVSSTSADALTTTAAVKVHGVSDTTAVALIERALAQNRISAEQALIYRVFASRGDARLPAEYDGAPQAAPSHLLMREVSGRLASLSQVGQDILLPFVVPPIYAQSWHAQQLGLSAGVGAGQGQAAGAQARARALSAGGDTGGRAKPLFFNVNCGPDDVPSIWVRRTTAHFNIYTMRTLGGPGLFGAQGDIRAEQVSEALAAVIEDVYTALTGVLQRFPISDASLACNGGDSAYDIYVLGWSQAGTVAEVTTYPGACENSASYMSVNSLHNYFNGVVQQPANAEQRRKVKSMVAHELMHALQFTVDRSAACDEYVWIDEATAQWATDHVDPGYNQEDGFYKLSTAGTRTGEHLLRYLGSDHMNSMEQPSRDQSEADRGYAGYLFFQYLARKYTANTMRQMLDAQTANASLESVAAALAARGGMKTVWPEFAQTLWMDSTERVLDYWNTTDRYDYGLANIFAPAAGDTFALAHPRLKTKPMDQAGQPRATFKLLESAHNFGSAAAYVIEPRSLFYEHLKFSDATVRSVLFVNPVAILPNREFMKVQAVKKIGGVWQPVEDWTAEPTRNFCRDKRDERLEELILIVSNSELNLGTEQPFHIPELFPMRISTSNVGCWRWVGSASTTKTYDDGAGLSGEITGNAVVRWDVSALLAGSLHFEPRAGLIDGSGSGRLGACTFTEVAERAVLDANAPPTGQPYGRLHMNLDLDLGFGDPPNRALTAFDGRATMQATRTMVCPSGTVASAGPSNFTWLQVDSDIVYTVSADGQTLEGEYVAAFPATRASIRTRFRFRAERE